MGGRLLEASQAIEIVKTWLETKFEGGRHTRRIQKILEIEKNNMNRHDITPKMKPK
jgi:ribose 5-phosphate isomerase B